MYTFILIAKRFVTPSCPGDLLKSLGSVRAEARGRYVVAGLSRQEDGWIAIARDDTVVSDYENEELNTIGSDANDLAFYIVEGGLGRKMYANGFIMSLPIDAGFLIDNDHGCIANIAKYQEMLSNGVDWLHWPK